MSSSAEILSAPMPRARCYPLTPELRHFLELAGVHERTLRNWHRGAVAAPPAARALARIIVHGELVQGGDAWSGWHLRRELLESPEGFTFAPHDVLNAHYWRACAEAALARSTAPAQFTLPGF